MATQPCACGNLGNSGRECRCTPLQIQSYRGRVSGPLLDRIDLHVEVPRVKAADLHEGATGESSAAVRARIARAREIQARRLGANGIRTNSQMGSAELREFCRLDREGRDLLMKAVDRLGLSARAHRRILKVARTLADLEGEEAIRSGHLAEAIQYRVLDRTGP